MHARVRVHMHMDTHTHMCMCMCMRMCMHTCLHSAVILEVVEHDGDLVEDDEVEKLERDTPDLCM